MFKYLRNFIILHFSDASRESIRNFFKSIPSLFIQSDLSALAKLYGTDKVIHGYTSIYETYFNTLRYQNKLILEIGIGGSDNPKSGGGSLKMWSKYFPNSKIIGIDIYDKSFFNSRKIKTHIGNQSDRIFLTKMISKYNEFDIIIDDGSHINIDVITTFKYLFPALVSEGFYIIEDTQTSYWAEYGGDESDLNNPNTIMNYFKSLIDELNINELRKKQIITTYFEIEFIHFYQNLIIIKKSK